MNIKRILICLFVAVVLTSCSTTTQKTENTQDVTTTEQDVSAETTEDALF